MLKVKGAKKDTPFSSGILGRSIEVIGIDKDFAYAIAEKIKNKLQKEKVKKVSRKRLRNEVYTQLEERLGKDKAELFMKFRKLRNLKKPLIILIGGSTGSGKSTLSVELAHRLGFTSVITTDMIREVMRSIISEKLMPFLHQSSYLAWQHLWTPLEKGSDPVLVAFKEQAVRIMIGMRSIIQRATQEGNSLIINGVHVLPMLIKPGEFHKVHIAKIFLYIKDSGEHRRRFEIRQEISRDRIASRYLENFKHIRKIQDFVIDSAQEHGLPCIDNRDFSETASWIVNYLVDNYVDGAKKRRKS